jgi:nucleoside-diphosphate-sugar epimerase
MKIILTGSTGFIGSEILTQCLANPSITSIIALSRRKLPDSLSSDPKLQTVILDDFATYNDEVLRECVGAEACIWYVATAYYLSHSLSHCCFPPNCSNRLRNC